MTLHPASADEPRDPSHEIGERCDLPSQDHVMARLRQLQSELIETARRSAMDAAGVAVAGRLDEPMSALLVHLRAIKRVGQPSSEGQGAPDNMWESLRMAIGEAQRVCDLLDEMRGGGEVAMNTQEILTRGRKAADGWILPLGSEADDRRVRAPLNGKSHTLTMREQEVVEQTTSGATNREGSRQLGISTRTFEAHRAHIMRKLGARNAADLVRAILSESR